VAAASWWPVSVANKRLRGIGNRSAQVIAFQGRKPEPAFRAKETIQN
jgi:hypothetical protein